MESKEENGRNDKRNLKNQMLQIHMTVQNGPNKKNRLRNKDDVEVDFA